VEVIARELDALEAVLRHEFRNEQNLSLTLEKLDAAPEGIRLHREAAEYLKGVMNGKVSLPVKEWKAELEKLTAE